MITAVSTEGIITCSCRSEVAVSMIESFVLCQCDVCGRRHRISSPRVEPLDFLERIGFRLFLDYDGQLLVESESEIPAELSKYIFQHQGSFRGTLQHRNREKLSVYIGGSLNGQEHHHGYSYHKARIVEKIGPKHWEAYEYRQVRDPRLFYAGRSTSEKKAKTGQFIPEEKRSRK